jgi:hypothetical protein
MCHTADVVVASVMVAWWLRGGVKRRERFMGESFAMMIVGYEYVRLVTWARQAHVGQRAVCVGRYVRRLAALEDGRLAGSELSLEELVTRSRRRGRAWKRWLIAMEWITPVHDTHPTILAGKEPS